MHTGFDQLQKYLNCPSIEATVKYLVDLMRNNQSSELMQSEDVFVHVIINDCHLLEIISQCQFPQKKEYVGEFYCFET